MSTKELAEEIVRGKGYIVLPGLLTSAEVSIAKEAILQLTSKERQRGKLAVQGYKERLYGLIYKGDIFSRLVEKKLVIEIIETILGEDIILGGFSAHILYPQAQRMGVHVDYPYWAMSSPFPQYPVLETQVIWMIDDFTLDNGSPLFAEGTQKLSTKPDVEKFELTARKITGKAGTVIISHGLCWHDTSENQSDQPRISLLGNYTPQYIHPLENHLYDFDQSVFDNFSPRLKKLLRHQEISNKPVFNMRYQNR